MARSEALGIVREVNLSAGRIRDRDLGEGPPVVFVHGLLVNADLWRAVVPEVAEAGLRCIAPDWPLGAHESGDDAPISSPRVHQSLRPDLQDPDGRTRLRSRARRDSSSTTRPYR